MDGRAWQATVLGVAKSQTRLSDSTFIFQVSCVHMVIFIDYTIFKFVKNNAHFFLYVQYILVYFICRRLLHSLECPLRYALQLRIPQQMHGWGG